MFISYTEQLHGCKEWCSRPRQRINLAIAPTEQREGVGMSELIISPQLLGEARCRSRGEYARSKRVTFPNKNIHASKSYPQKVFKLRLQITVYS